MSSGHDSEFIDTIVAAEKRRISENRQRIERRREDLRSEAGRLASLMVECDPGIKRIRLFGSVLPRRTLRSDSDLDIAVEGATRFSDLRRTVEESDWPVDLIEWETMPESIRNVVARDAEVLYES